MTAAVEAGATTMEVMTNEEDLTPSSQAGPAPAFSLPTVQASGFLAR